MALGTTGINTTLVSKEIGAGSTDVGTLCKHTNINKWSKYKPVQHSKRVGLVDADFKSVRSGMNIPSVMAHPSSGYVPIMDYYRNNPNFEFTYNKPRGVNATYGWDEPFRLGDFRGYEHSADIFYDVEVIPEIVASPLRVNLYNFDTAGWLDWSALNLDSLYFGAVVVRRNQTSPASLIWAPEPLSGSDNRLQYPLTPTPPTGTQYDVFAVIGEPPLDPEDPDNNLFYLLQDGHRVVKYGQVLTVSLDAEWMGSNVEWYVYITNNGTSGYETMTECEILIRYADNSPDPEIDELEPGERRISLGTLTIQPQSSINHSEQTLGALPDFVNRGGVVYFNSARTMYNTSTEVIWS